MKKLFLLFSLLSCLQLNALEKIPTDKQCVAMTIKPFAVTALGIGAAGLAYSGFLYYSMLTDPRARAYCQELNSFVFKVASTSTVLGSGLYALTKHLEK